MCVYLLGIYVYKCVHVAYVYILISVHMSICMHCVCVFVSMYVSVHALCLAESVSTQRYARMKRKCQDLRHPLSTLVLETASLTEPRGHLVTRLAG